MKITYRQVHSLLSFIVRQAIRDCDLDVAEDNVLEYCKKHFPSADNFFVSSCIDYLHSFRDNCFFLADLVFDLVKYGCNTSTT